MKRHSRSPLAVLLTATGALLLFVPLVLSEQGYSRARWVAEGVRRGVRYSGGIMPGTRSPEIEQLLSQAWRQPGRGRGARGVAPGLSDTRISHDILPPDGVSGAQPGTEAEPYLAVDPGDPNRLLAFYQEDRFPSIGGARALTYALSTDGGRHWQEGLLPSFTVVSGGAFDRASDPWVAFGTGHQVYCSGLAFDDADALGGILVSASKDGGATWADPVQVHAQSSSAIDDKDAIAVDTNPHSPYFGRVYVGWDISPNDPAQSQTLVMAHSTDGGATFSSPATIFDQGGNIGIIPLVGPGGIVHAIWLHYTAGLLAGSIESSSSTDGGDTWSPPVKVADVFAAPVPGSRTADGLPSAALDPATGNVFVAWQDERFTPGTDQILLTVSADGTSGWTSPRRISDGPANVPNFTPAVAVNGAGQVAVAYYSFRNSPPGTSFMVDEYLTVGGPRGRPFSRGRRESFSSWDMRAAAVADGLFFLGDYQGLAPSGRNFLPLWVATFATSTIDPPAKEPDVYSVAVGR
ncbi:MAG TPA: sialidase family protein [Thermoanaerobaculia bacterium]|nr:sialidase family protein [Thermoanaerobaculia bacterium]